MAAGSQKGDPRELCPNTSHLPRGKEAHAEMP